MKRDTLALFSLQLDLLRDADQCNNNWKQRRLSLLIYSKNRAEPEEQHGEGRKYKLTKKPQNPANIRTSHHSSLQWFKTLTDRFSRRRPLLRAIQKYLFYKHKSYAGTFSSSLGARCLAFVLAAKVVRNGAFSCSPSAVTAPFGGFVVSHSIAVSLILLSFCFNGPACRWLSQICEISHNLHLSTRERGCISG